MPGGPTEGPGTWATYQLTTRGAVCISAVAGTAMGSVLIGGGPERFASLGFATARLLYGQQYTWGGMFLAAGLVCLVGILRGWRRVMVMAGLFALGVLFFFFAVALAVSFKMSPSVAGTGVVAYSSLAALCGVTFAGGWGLKPR